MNKQDKKERIRLFGNSFMVSLFAGGGAFFLLLYPIAPTAFELLAAIGACMISCVFYHVVSGGSRG